MESRTIKKILTIDQGIQIITKERQSGKSIVLVGGVFDILHLGHVRFLEAAKKAGDILVVALEPDSKVRKLKGEGRPINDEQTRAYMLSSLSFVDYVVIIPELTTDAQYAKLTKDFTPDIVAVTEGDPKRKQKQVQVTAIGGKLNVVTPKIPTPSTTQRIKLLALE